MYETMSLLMVLYGRETWPLTLREERRLMAFESRVLIDPRWMKDEEVAGRCIMKSFMTCFLSQMKLPC
jgi:hypothetical protein